MAGELSVRVPLVTTTEGVLSAEAIARGADGQVISTDGTRLVPQGAKVVAMDGVPCDASLVLQQAAAETTDREVALVLAFEPPPEAVDKRGADALNIYVPPSMRRKIPTGLLRAPAGYTEWAKAMHDTRQLPQLQLQFINKPTPLVLAIDGVFDSHTAEEIINLARPRFRRSTVSTLDRLDEASLYELVGVNR